MTEVLLAGAAAAERALARCLEQGGLEVRTSPYGPAALADRHVGASHAVAGCLVFRCPVAGQWPEPDVLDAVCRLRRRGRAAILVALVDDDRGEGSVWSTVVAALLEAGADDVLAARAEGVEVCARIRALVRRHLAGDPDRAGSPGCGGCPGPPPRVDSVRRRLVGRLGSVGLTEKEFLVMQTILECDGLARRECIARRVWCDTLPGSKKAIDMHVASLRRKLRRVCGADWCIETVRGAGFVLVDEASSRGEPPEPAVRPHRGETPLVAPRPSTLGG